MTQPKPKKNTYPHVVDEVLEDIKERKRLGIERYGVALQPFNGRNAIQDAYEEALDLCVYLKQVMMEVDLIKADLINGDNSTTKGEEVW